VNTATLVKAVVDRIKRIEGVSAVVLGGSRARGTHTPTSDLDLSIYYHPDSPLDVNALDQVAAEFDDSHRAGLVTPLGDWGPWINGGGWLTIQSQPVDFLYRDLKKVGFIIDACLGGQVEVAYQPGHPHGFVSSEKSDPSRATSTRMHARHRCASSNQTGYQGRSPGLIRRRSIIEG
jgi:Nucleotidyltransferase domain